MTTTQPDGHQPGGRLLPTAVQQVHGDKYGKYGERSPAEPYREGRRLTPVDLPNSVLAHLDGVWSERQVLTYHQRATADRVTAGLASYLTDLERHVLDHVGRDAIGRKLAVLWCSVSWSQVGVHDSQAEPWVPGGPLHEWAFFVMATATGVAVPMLAGPAGPAADDVPDSPLYLFRCNFAGCVYQQHGNTRVAPLREHPLTVARVDPTPVRSGELTPANRCPGSGNLAQGFDVAAAQAFENDRPLFLFRCGATGCEHTQHSIISTMMIREHTVDGVRCPGSGVMNTAGADLSRRHG